MTFRLPIGQISYVLHDDITQRRSHSDNAALNILMVVVGAHDLRDSKSSDHIRVKSYIPHPKYEEKIPYQPYDDIMLLKLEKKVQLNKKVGVIPLPKKGEDVKAEASCSVAGWGRLTDGSASNVLMEAKVSGDSGGPLVCGNTAVGITSFSALRCNSSDHPNGYTKISAYIQWIDIVTRNV
ncbi:Granzyme-like protein 2 [Anabarilius grahami]|uniref:Granzyme-like protein 2 n=1 Tax=Anabarilius grahami TaxID=495550 RepID=A0A3N0Z6T0_ANAGA|nr:Granzyme-like protein 2 [Anabarilius grahami]